MGRFPLGYKRSRRSALGRMSAQTPTTSPTESNGDGQDEFMTEKTYAFELDDDDNDEEG